MKFDITKFNPCREGLEYYESQESSASACNNCPRGDWMLWIAARLEIDHRILTRAKALCANTVRHLMKDRRSTDAIDAAFRYADGEISREELANYYREADAADADYAAAYASAYYAAAAVATDAAYFAASKANQRETAAICREVLAGPVFEKVDKLIKGEKKLWKNTM